MGLIRDIDHTLSYTQKMADSAKWVKDSAEVFFQNINVPHERMRRHQIKEALSKGDFPYLNEQDKKYLNIRMNPVYKKRDFNRIAHEPIINTHYNTMIGERQRMPFEPIAVDIGLFSRSEKERLHLLYLQNFLKKNIYEPYKAGIMQQYSQENGIQDVTQLDHDQQQQMMSDVNQRLLEMTPDKINSYFNKEYVSPVSEEAQMLLNHEVKRSGLKHIFEDRFKDLYRYGMEISYLYESHGNPFIENCDEDRFAWEGSEDCEFLEDGEVAVYRTERTLMDIITRYGDKMKMGSYKELETNSGYTNNIGPNGVIKELFGDQAESRLLGFFSDQGKVLFEKGVNFNSPEGNRLLMDLKTHYAGNYNAIGSRITDAHVAFKTMVTRRKITRIVDGREEFSFRSNEYVFNPDLGDIKEVQIRNAMVMQCRRIGNAAKCVYIEAGPLDFPWLDIDNPRQVKLPYWGVIYNRRSNRKGIVMTPFDNGIPLQLKYNMESARLELQKSYNIGKVFKMFQSAKPKEMEWPEFMEMITVNKVIPIDETKLVGLAGQMASAGHMFKAEDLTNIAGVTETLQELEVIDRRMMQAMSINEERAGEGNRYQNKDNMQQNLINSGNKTLDLHTIHNIGINNTLQGYMELCHHVYKKNPKVLSWVSSDMTTSTLRLSDNFLNFAKMGTYMTNNPEEHAMLKEVKAEFMNLIQNDKVHLAEKMARIYMAKSPAELLNVTIQLAKQMEDQAKVQQETQQQLIQQDAAMKKEERNEDYAHEQTLADKKNQTAIETALIRVEELAKQYDINENNINDLNEKDEKRLRYEENRDNEDRKVDREKLQVEMSKIFAAKKQNGVPKK